MSSTGRRRSNIRQYSAEGEALNQISKEAEDRLAAKRAARAEAREIRQREIERKMKEQEMAEGNGEPPADVTPKNYRDEEPEDVPVRDKDRDFKNEFRELEEKYKGAMFSLAQLDNERTALNYSVDLLKEDLEEREEGSLELQRQLKEKTRDLDFARRDFKDCERQLAQVKEILAYQEKVMEESGFMIVRDEEGKMVIEKTSTIHNGPINNAVLLTSETLGLLQKEEGTLGTATNRPTCSRATQTPSHFTQTEGTDVPDGEESPSAATPSSSAADDGPATPVDKPDQSSDATGQSSKAAEEAESSVDGVAVEVSQGLHEDSTQEGDVEALCVVTDEPDGSGGGTSSGVTATEASPSAKDRMVLEVGSEGAINREDSGISSPDATTTTCEGSAKGVLLTGSVECASDVNLTRKQPTRAGSCTGGDQHSDEEEFYDACSSPLPSPLNVHKFTDAGSSRLTEDESKPAQGAEAMKDAADGRLDQSSVDIEGTSVDGPEFLPKEEKKVEERPVSSLNELLETAQPAEPQKKNKKRKKKKKKKQQKEEVTKEAHQEEDGGAAGGASLKKKHTSDGEGSEGSEEGLCDKPDEPELKATSDETTKTSSTPEIEKQEIEEQEKAKSELLATAPEESEKPLQQVDLNDTQSDQNKPTAEAGKDTAEEIVQESQENKGDPTTESQETRPDPTAEDNSREDDKRDEEDDLGTSEKAADASDIENLEGDNTRDGGDDHHDADTVSEDPEQMSRQGSQKRKQEGFDRTLSAGTLPQDKKLKFDEADQSEVTEKEEEQPQAEEAAEADTVGPPVKFEAGEEEQVEQEETGVTDTPRPDEDSTKGEGDVEVPQSSEVKESKDTESTDGITEVAETLASSPAESKADLGGEVPNQDETVHAQLDQESHDKEENKETEGEKRTAEEKEDQKEDEDGIKTEEKLETSHETKEDVHQEEQDEERAIVENQDNAASKEQDGDQQGEKKAEQPEEALTEPAMEESLDNAVENQENVASNEDGGNDQQVEEKVEQPDEDDKKTALEESHENTEVNPEGDATEEPGKQTRQTSTPLQKSTSLDHSEDGGNDEYDFDDIDEVLEIPAEPGVSESSDQQDKVSQLSSPSLDTLDTLDTTSTHSGISTDRLDTGSMASLLSSSDDKQGEEAAATPSKSSEKSEHGKHSKKKSKGDKAEKSDKSSKGNPLGSFRKSKKSKADGGSQTPGEQAEKGSGGGAGSGADHPEKHEKDKKKGFFKNLFK